MSWWKCIPYLDFLNPTVQKKRKNLIIGFSLQKLRTRYCWDIIYFVLSFDFSITIFISFLHIQKMYHINMIIYEDCICKIIRHIYISCLFLLFSRFYPYIIYSKKTRTLWRKDWLIWFGMILLLLFFDVLYFSSLASRGENGLYKYI